MSSDTASPILAAASPPMNVRDDAERRPPLSRSSSSLSGLVNRGAGRVGEDWSEGLVLLDVIETFFDSRLDLWERRLKEQSRRLAKRAAELVPKGLRTPKGSAVALDEYDDSDGASAASGTALAGTPGAALTKRAVRHKQDMERELSRLKVNLATRVNNLSESWASDKVVRTREKFSFVLGVQTVACTCLLYGLNPTWFPVAYTVQSLIYLTWRVISYKRKHFHYFLFDLCYFVNVLDLVWLWFFPSSTVMFICAYCLTMGPLASAIITWRNSLVFHSIDKVTSLFIHIYPPIVFAVILFRYPGAAERYPGIVHVNDYGWMQRIAISAVPYCLWQLTYWKFISVDRKEKIASGQRENSFHYLLHDKHNPIGRALRGIKSDRRETWFMFGQLIYSIVFMIPASALFLNNATATYVCLAVLFLVSSWNGATFYVEVFGRKFAKELEKLRKEMEAMSVPGSSSSGPTPSNPSTPYADSGAEASVTGEKDALANSPLVLPTAGETSVPGITLDKPKAE